MKTLAKRWLNAAGSALMTAAFISVLVATPQARALPLSDRIQFSGKQIYVNGTNVAWHNWARDVGANPSGYDAGEPIIEDHDDLLRDDRRRWCSPPRARRTQARGR